MAQVAQFRSGNIDVTFPSGETRRYKGYASGAPGTMTQEKTAVPGQNGEIIGFTLGVQVLEFALGFSSADFADFVTRAGRGYVNLTYPRVWFGYDARDASGQRFVEHELVFFDCVMSGPVPESPEDGPLRFTPAFKATRATHNNVDIFDPGDTVTV